ncbi:MAG: hypothetical protein M1347_08215 [Chloroflexi bacterium]|nr:hypothetical protein [Chloroflexota bacterium]
MPEPKPTGGFVCKQPKVFANQPCGGGLVVSAFRQPTGGGVGGYLTFCQPVVVSVVAIKPGASEVQTE